MKPCDSRLQIPQIIILHELWPLLQLQSVFERKTKIYDISISTRHFNKVMCQKITSTQKTLKREQGETERYSGGLLATNFSWNKQKQVLQILE